MIACPADSQSFHSIGTRDSAHVGPESWLGGFIDQALASFGGKYAVIQQTRMGHGKALYSAVPGGTSCFLWTLSRHWPAPAQSAVRVLHAGLLSVAPSGALASIREPHSRPSPPVILSEPERRRSKGESKDPENISPAMPIQGALTKIGTRQTKKSAHFRGRIRSDVYAYSLTAGWRLNSRGMEKPISVAIHSGLPLPWQVPHRAMGSLP